MISNKLGKNYLVSSIKKSLDKKNYKLNYNIKKNINILKDKYLDQGKHYIIIKNFEKNDKTIKTKLLKFAKLFGNLVSQDRKGNKIVNITPDVKTLKGNSSQQNRKKLRYHKTNLGGSIHSDGPQLNHPPKYVIMACVFQSKKGGDSIIVNTKKIYDYLKKFDKKNVEILKRKFIFEKRGFSTKKNKIIKKPIFIEKKNKFLFRYLKDYVLKGYELSKIKLSDTEKKSLSNLDNLLDKRRFQKKYKLNSGDLILLNNYYLAHGRSSFKIDQNRQRSIYRVWVN